MQARAKMIQNILTRIASTAHRGENACGAGLVMEELTMNNRIKVEIRDRTIAIFERHGEKIGNYIFGAAIGMTVVLAVLGGLFRALMR